MNTRPSNRAILPRGGRWTFVLPLLPLLRAGWVGRFVGLLLLAVVLSFSQSSALAATGLGSDYLLDSWQTENGLPENSATCLTQTPDGYIWFGTFNGLVRFDGARFTVFDPANTPELPDAGVVNLHLDREGALWVSTIRGLAVLRDGKWRALGKTHITHSSFVRTFAENAGVLCYTTYDGRVFKVDRGQPVELPPPPGFPGRGYWSHVDPKGVIWVAQDEFFGRWDGTRWVTSALQSVVTNNFRGIGRARDGRLLAAGSGRMMRIEGDRIVAEQPLPEAPGALWQIFEDSRTNVWICTQESGVQRLDPSGATFRYSVTTGLTYDGIRFAFEDRERNIWLGSSGGGLMRIKPRLFLEQDLSLLRPVTRMTALFEEAPGNMLVGSYGKGLVRVQRSGVEKVRPTDGGELPKHVQSVLRDRRGRTWLGAYHDSVHVMEADGRHRRFEPKEVGGLDVTALFEDALGRVWIGGSETVSVWDGVKLQLFAPTNGLFLGTLKSFAENPRDGALWACSSEGVFRHAQGRWTEIRDAAGKPLEGSVCLRAEEDGTVWIGGATVSLRRFRDGVLSQVTEAQGLPVRIISSLLDDGRGFWWLGSNRGVVRVARSELEAAANGGRTPLSCQLFTMSDGLPSVECVAGMQSTALKDSAGRLWFATMKGLAVVDPATLQLNTNPPPVFVEQFRIEDRANIQKVLATGGAATVMVPPGQREISVQFNVLSFTAPEKVRLSYRLQGMHDEWVDMGNRRTFYFYPPPPGSYRLWVRAANNDGLWNEAGASVAFVVQPLLWQTLWFRLGALAGLVGVTSLTVWRTGRSRLHQKIERLEQQRALKEERARLASVLEATSDFVAFAQEDGRMLFVNRAGRAMLGLGEREGLDGLRLEDFYPAWAVQVVRGVGLPAAVSQGTWSGEIALLHRGGREIPVSQVIVALLTQDGRVDFMSMIARDISEQRRAVDALRESEERFRALVEHSPDCISVSLDDRIVYANPAAVRMVGAERVEQMLGRSIYDFLPRETHDAVRSGRDSVLLAGQPAPPAENVLLRLDGSTLQIESISVPLTFMGRRAVLNLNRDITDRKQAEAVLLESRAKLVMAMEMARLAHWEYDVETGLFTFDDDFYRLLGTTAAEQGGVLTRPEDFARRFIPPDESTIVRVEIELAVATTDPAYSRRLQHRIIRSDGSTGVVSVKLAIVKDAAGRTIRIYGANQDITEEKLAEEKRLELEAQLRKVQKLEALGTLAGGIAHDFNNILGAIISFTELTRMDNPHNPELQENLRQVLQASNRAASLVRQILSFSRQQKQERKVIQIAPVVGEALKLLRSTLPSTIEIHQQIQGGLRDVFADSTQIHQVIMNLCTNAAHAMRGQQGRLVVALEAYEVASAAASPHRELQVREYLRLRISDTGHGMDEATMSRVFEPFFTTKGPGEGTGLGLAVVHGIIKDHEGVITVESTPGQGTSFTIYLPTVALAADQVREPVAEAPMGRGERILFVDDEKALGETARKLLGRYGFQVEVFHRAQDAWEAFQREPTGYDAVVADLTMPVMTGLDLASRMLELRPDLLVFVMTGHGGPLKLSTVRELGIRDMFSKPIEYRLLAQKLCEGLAGQRNGSTESS